jgi:hypothetical protein
MIRVARHPDQGVRGFIIERQTATESTTVVSPGTHHTDAGSGVAQDRHRDAFGGLPNSLPSLLPVPSPPGSPLRKGCGNRRLTAGGLGRALPLIGYGRGRHGPAAATRPSDTLTSRPRSMINAAPWGRCRAARVQSGVHSAAST